MKTKFLSLVAMGALVIGGIGSGIGGSTQDAEAAPNAGALGLVAAVVQVQTEDINVLNSSLNNVHVLENILNNSPILNNVDVTVIDGDVTIQDILNICEDNPGNCLISGNDVTVDNVTVNVSDIVAIIEVLDLDGVPGYLIVF